MVSFLSGDASLTEFRRRGFDQHGLIEGTRADARMRCTAFTYKSGASDYNKIADCIAAHFGEFSDVLVWAAIRVLGDYTGEDIDRPDWAEYAGWRLRHGAEASLGEKPGHRFEAGEGAELRKLIQSALSLGWDTLLRSDTTKTIVKLSHDDRIELYYFSAPAKLKEKLARVCASAPWFDPRRR